MTELGQKQVYEQQTIKEAENTKNDPSWKELKSLIAGASSGAITKTATAPLERVKILFQLQGMNPELRMRPKYTGVIQTLYTVCKEEGFLALYKGNGANVIRVIPVYALKFACNDTFKDLVRREGQPRNTLTFNQMMFAGSLAGLFQIICTYPLEVIRTRLSLAEALQSGVKYKGITDCAIKTIKTEGFRGVYKGITPTLLSGTPYVGLQMTFYETFKRFSPKKQDGSTSVLTKLVCGALAGIVAQSITYPGDTLRRRMQISGMGGQKLAYRNTWHACITITKEEGFRAFYRGIHVNNIRGIPGAAIQFVSYDLVKKMLGLETT